MALTTVTGSLVSVNAIQGTLIADNAITAVHIATNAVSGTLIADNAVTAVHIAQNSITVTQLADDCVESDKIADGIITTNHLNKAMISSQTEVTAATGDFVLLGDTSDSNNLKKTPVSSIIGLASGTTINNNADNRVITGSGTANTLEGESGLTYDGDTLQVKSGGNNRFKVNNSGSTVESGNLIFNPGTGSLGNKYVYVNGGTGADGGFILQRNNANQWQIAPDPGSDDDLNFYSYGTSSTVLRIDRSSGQVNFGAGLGIGGTGAANTLDDYEEGTWTPAFYTYSGVTTSSITITLATYTKIGNICHIHANITATLSSLPGQTITITGLPFAASGSDQYGIIAVGGHTVNTGANTPKAHFRTNGSQLDGIAYNASSNTAFWTYSTMDAQPFEMSIHGFYTTT